MKWRLFAVAAAISGLVFVAVAGLWAKGFSRSDTITWGGAGKFRQVWFAGDEVYFFDLDDLGMKSRPVGWRTHRWNSYLLPPPPSQQPNTPAGSYSLALPGGAAPAAREFLPPFGLGYADFPNWYGPGTRLRSIRVSYFLVMGLAAVLPSAWMVRAAFRWRLRFGPGRCRRCGYDLTGNVSGVCPECGSPVSSPAGKAGGGS